MYGGILNVNTQFVQNSWQFFFLLSYKQTNLEKYFPHAVYESKGFY